MKQPPSFSAEGQENLVCKLKKSMYGLKQLPWCWNSTPRNQLKAWDSFRRAIRASTEIQESHSLSVFTSMRLFQLEVVNSNSEELSQKLYRTARQCSCSCLFCILVWFPPTTSRKINQLFKEKGSVRESLLKRFLLLIYRGDAVSPNFCRPRCVSWSPS